MSDATYRIEVEHLPGETFAYYGRVYLMSDPLIPQFTTHDDEYERCRDKCYLWIREQNRKRETVTIYVDDDGMPVDQYSVRA